MAKNTDSADKANVLAITLTPEFATLVKDAAKKQGVSAAHMGRVAVLTAAAKAMGVAVPEIVESKKGPKAGAKLNPLAEKFGLTNAELGRRMQALVNQGFSVAKLKDYDFSQDPAPVKHRATKASAAQA